MADTTLQKHYIKFTTSDWGENEFMFGVDPLTDYHDAALDHHIQVEIVQHMKVHNIKGKDKKFVYFDENMNEIMHNDHALEHGKYEYPKNKKE